MTKGYVDNLETELNGKVTIATFEITEENTVISLPGLSSYTKIDWGDGTLNANIEHTYVATGTYKCKIYGLTKLQFSVNPMLMMSGRSCLTNLIISNDITTIGVFALYGCDNLTELVISDSVVTIENDAFTGCGNLTKVTFGKNVTSIGSAFMGCSSLKNITIPSGVTSIVYGTFRNCTSLTSVEIPDSVTAIDSYAFAYCGSLTNVVIGSNVCYVTIQPQTLWDTISIRLVMKFFLILY